MTGRLSNIYICSKKGEDTKVVFQANLDEKQGLIGDYKSESGNKDRQLVILLDIDRENIDKNYKDIGLCTQRFKENLLIKGVNPNELDVFTRLKIGKSKVEITSVGKKCFDECQLVNNKEFCPLKHGAIFARVIESGLIRVGDKIEKYSN